MGKATGKLHFKNPNLPPQPQCGVYRWYFVLDDCDITIYVGCSRSRRNFQYSLPSTLFRGLSEARRSCISSDFGKTLDTDFIVGSALSFLLDKGYECIWEHLSDDPDKEKDFCKKFRPFLQESMARLKSKYKLRGDRALKPSGPEKDFRLAENRLFELFDADLCGVIKTKG